MSYKPRYTLTLAANPSIPGVTTIVEQQFDGTQLTDRYIKQLTNALRRYGVLPRYGGMYSTAQMLAQQLDVKPPLGVMLRKWSAHAYVVGPRWDEWPETAGDKNLWAPMINLCDVRSKMAFAAGTPPEPRAYRRQLTEPDVSMWDRGYLLLAGWRQGELTPFREALKEHALAKIPGYLEDMECIAAFLETRPKFVVQERKALTVLNNKRDPKGTIVK